jgi:hypothetical protein
MKNILQLIIVALLSTGSPVFAQAPVLGSASTFVLFTTAGAITNTGISHITGNVGASTGAITGFGNVNGVMHPGDVAAATGAADVLTAYGQLDAAIAGYFIGPAIGNDDTLIAGVYSISGNATLSDTLILDGQANPDAVFIIKIQGAFASATAAKVILINGAKACNVFWKTEGMVSLANETSMKGTLIAHNAAIDIGSGVTWEGRALSTTGAITLNSVLAYLPAGCGSPVLTGPAPPDMRSAACYVLFTGNYLCYWRYRHQCRPDHRFPGIECDRHHTSYTGCINGQCYCRSFRCPYLP